VRILIALSFSLLANAALAQVDPAADHYRAGANHFRAGRYANAIQEFRAADAIRPSPVLSFDIAQCFEKMADLVNAKVAYQDYLRRAPGADDRQAVEATIASIDQKLSQQNRETVMLVPSTVLPMAEQSVQKQPPSLALALTGVSVGAAGIIAGAILNAVSHNASQSLQSEGVGGQGYWSSSKAQGYYSTAKDFWTGALIGYIAGGVLLASGGGLLTYQLATRPAAP
jgi:tetratricopeptide (TPR) repeat protein